MEEIETFGREEKQTVTEKFRAAEGKEVPEDYFLFACMEAEKLLRNKDEEDLKSWPGLENLTADSDPAALIIEAAKWHLSERPELEECVVDYSVVGIYAEATVAIAYDIEQAFKKMELEVATVRRGDTLPEMWKKISDAIGAQLGKQFGPKLLRHLTWSYGGLEKLDLSQMPPVGRFAPRMPRRPSNDSRGPRRDGGGKGRPGGNDRGPRGGSGPRSSGGPRNDRGPRKDSGPRNDRGPRKDSGPRSDRGPRRDGGGKRGAPKVDKNVEAAMLKEVLSGIDAINQGNAEAALKPQNSFNRRLQHQLIESEGFKSKSSGEGHDRHVCIVKKG